MRLKIRHFVERRRASGAVAYYWVPSAHLAQRGWALRRLPDDREAAIAAAEQLNREVDAARERGAAPRDNAGGRTLGHLIAAYRADQRYMRLAPATRRLYDQCLARLLAWAGDAPVSAIAWPRIAALQRAMRDTPGHRNNVVRVLRLVLSYGVQLGWLASNPAARPGIEGLPPSGLIWPREAVAAFVAMADRCGRPSVGTAVALNEWIGQRPADLLRLSRSAIRNGTLLIRQHKTGAALALPIGRVAPLMARLEAEMARAAQRPAVPLQLLIDEHTGRPWSVSHFGHVFASVRAALAAERPSFEIDWLMPGRNPGDPDAFRIRTSELLFRHLRHTAITRLAEAECEVPLIAAVSGHSLASVQQILARYLVRTRQQAVAAFDRRLAAERRSTSDVERGLNAVAAADPERFDKIGAGGET